MVPKSLALQRAERIALAIADPVEVFIFITRPLIRLMNVSATLVLGLFDAPLRAESSAHSPEELKLMATATRRMGQLPAIQEQMIHRALELSQVTASEIMTPRGKIFSLSADLPLEAASARIVEEQHSRIPVFDPARAATTSSAWSTARTSRVSSTSARLPRPPGPAPSGITLRQVMHDILLVPETKLAVELLQEFQERRRQIAIVVDEFGSTLGLVTAEDVLEQIVGELEDEFDTARSLPLPASDGGLLLDGTASLRDLVTQLHWKFPREAGVETLAGFLLAKLGHIPAEGEHVDFGGRRFAVQQMKRQRIVQVRVDPIRSRTSKPSETQASSSDEHLAEAKP